MDARRALEQARSALAEDRLEDAAEHVSVALSHAPTLPEAHELLSKLAGRLDLFPATRHASVGRLAARAHLLAAAGRPDEALPLLAAASSHPPHADWAGVPWVADAELARKLDPGLLVHVLMRLCTAVGDPAPKQARATLRPYLEVARQTLDLHPAHAMLLGSASALARRIGETTLAVEWAVRGAQARPSKLGEIWLGYALRSAGRVPEALVALRRAVTHDPDDLSVYADIAGTLADQGRLADALAWIDRALARDPAYDCAVHTGHRLRYRADGDLDHLVALADFTRDHPDESHEHTDLADCCHGLPWLSGVPTGFSATLPAPGLSATSGSPVVSGAPTSTGPGSPAAAGPNLSDKSDFSVRLKQVATTTWPHPPGAYDAAVALLLVPRADLLTAIDSPPAGIPAPEVWACLGLLHHDAEQPWAGSDRRATLHALLARTGPAAEAAMFALIVTAWVDPTARADVAATVAERLAEPGARPYANLALATPGLDGASRDRASALAHAVPQQRTPRRRSRLLLRWRRQ